MLWYISNGTLIGAGITFISLASEDFKKDVNAISADPATYLATYLRYLAVQYYVIGTDTRSATRLVGIADDSNRDDKEPNPVQSTTSFGCFSSLWGLVDSLLLMIWMLIIFVVTLLWVAVVIPLQYFVFLICGAPARYFHPSEYRVISGVEDNKRKLRYIAKSEETPSGWHDASMGIEPFTLTNLLSILFFAAAEYILL